MVRHSTGPPFAPLFAQGAVPIHEDSGDGQDGEGESQDGPEDLHCHAPIDSETDRAHQEDDGVPYCSELQVVVCAAWKTEGLQRCLWFGRCDSGVMGNLKRRGWPRGLRTGFVLRLSRSGLVKGVRRWRMGTGYLAEER